MSDESSEDPSIHAPGWEAIDRWVSSKLPAQTPHQFTSKTPYDLDKASPLPAAVKPAAVKSTLATPASAILRALSVSASSTQRVMTRRPSSWMTRARSSAP